MKNLTLYTKPGCHLSNVMKSVINELRSDSEFNFLEINIEQDDELSVQYKDKIPVLKMDGRIIAKFRIDKEKLRKLLFESN